MSRILQICARIRGAVRRWLLRKLRPCRQIVPMMSESMERPLTVLEKLELQLHLLICAWCKHYLKQIGMIECALRFSLPEEQLAAEPAMTPEARNRIARTLLLSNER